MKKILIIEDDEMMCDLLREVCNEEGFHVLAAHNGEDGIQVALREIPDLILSDVMMPKIDGHEVLRQLKQSPRTATIPFIFLTGMGERRQLRAGMELGADDYLTKPFTPEELLNALHSRLDREATRQAQGERRVEQLRDELTTSLPHELLTPLNGILGLSRMIVEDAEQLEPYALREMGEHIQRSAQRLQHLVGKYLCYAQLLLLKNNQPRMEEFRAIVIPCVADIVARVVHAMTEGAHRNGDLHLTTGQASLRMLPEHLERMLAEVVENAIKFSRPGDMIRVALHATSDAVEIRVTDAGRGMSAEQIKQIGAYVQFDRRTYEQQGAGLGLSIVGRIAELYGGRLEVESAPGAGTMVRVLIPTA